MKNMIYGGKIITMANPLYADSLIIENGVISAVGSEKELIEKYKPDKKINLRGAAAVPGFIDSHSHFTQTAYALLQADLSGAANEKEISAAISNFIKENNIKKGEWIIARGYDNNLLAEKKNLLLERLDFIAPENPLVIQHKSGHMGLFNSLALKELGVDGNTVSPKGGKIEVINGLPTGYMEENAFFEYLKKTPRPPEKEIKKALAGAQKKYASYGITTVQDGMAVPEMLPVYKSLIDDNSLFVDLVVYCDSAAFEYVKKEMPDTVMKYKNRFKTGGIKNLSGRFAAGKNGLDENAV